MAEAYDPSEVEERPKNAYLSRKDIRILLVAVVLLVVLLTPVVWLAKMSRDKYMCKANLGQMYKAMSLYLIENDNRYPPVYVVGANGEPAELGPKGEPYTWMSVVHENMSTRYSFDCPAAGDDEKVKNLHPAAEKAPFDSSYGLYYPRSTFNSTFLANPATSILVAETSNQGANATFDPQPFKHRYDGMAIGWNDGNFGASKLSESVTRLAFPDTKSGAFNRKGKGRHGDGILVLYADGRLGYLHPDAAEVQRIGSEIVGSWSVR